MSADPRIRDLRALLLRFPLETPLVGPFGRLEARHNLIIVVETDAGARGLGEIWANFPHWGCSEKVNLFEQVVRPLLMGEVIDDPRRLFALMRERLRLLALQWGAPGPVQQVIAGVDAAIWDAWAREKGVPLADALRGEAAPRRVPVYASGIGPGVTAALIEKSTAIGHRRFKVRISFGREADTATLRSAREAAGDRPLMADANQTYSPEMLRLMEVELRAAKLQWLEEPFPVDEDETYRGWPHIRGLPLALGENAYGAHEFERIMDAYDPAAVQPDITKNGGVSEGFEIGRSIVARGKRFCLHNFGGAVGLYTSAHLTAGVAGADWLEMDANPNPSFEHVLASPPEVVDGALVLSGEPGLGIDLADDRIGKWQLR